MAIIVKQHSVPAGAVSKVKADRAQLLACRVEHLLVMAPVMEILILFLQSLRGIFRSAGRLLGVGRAMR